MKSILSSDLIPGIYNYCDGLCQGCAFKHRCAVMSLLNYMEKKMGDNENIIPVLEVPMQFVSTGMDIEKMGMEWDDGEEQKIIVTVEMEERWQDYAKNHPLTELALKYRGETYKVMTEKFGDVMREKEKELRGLEKMGLLSRDSVVSGLKEFAGHLEMIMAFQLYYEVKVVTALTIRERWRETGDHEEKQHHHDGIMKAVLLSINKSIRAWKQALELAPELEEDGARLLHILQQLKECAESEFPDAMQFRRPGFDD